LFQELRHWPLAAVSPTRFCLILFPREFLVAAPNRKRESYEKVIVRSLPVPVLDDHVRTRRLFF
jgi:hypothetical protein